MVFLVFLCSIELAITHQNGFSSYRDPGGDGRKSSAEIPNMDSYETTISLRSFATLARFASEQSHKTRELAIYLYKFLKKNLKNSTMLKKTVFATKKRLKNPVPTKKNFQVLCEVTKADVTVSIEQAALLLRSQIHLHLCLAFTLSSFFHERMEALR